MTEIRPFRIEATDDQLSDLNRRLEATRFPDEETPDDWSQGTPLSYMKEIRDYWLHNYDWREREALLNRWEGFTTELDGLDIHFLHVRSKHENAKPLVITHGWPGSIVEFQKVIEPLTDPTAHGGTTDDAFHLVLPSLPGYGFSGKPTTPGWNLRKIAGAWNELMLRLGYDRYLAQGGDWGSAVTAEIGTQNLGNCIGLHLNMANAGPTPDEMDNLTEFEKKALAALQFYQDQDSGYSKEQSTRPQTLGYGLVDSPIGQAAWILEKFYQWMDCNGHPENIASRDELLDNIMLYWLPGAGASSARLYWESFGKGGTRGPIDIPSGYSAFPKDIFLASERWLKRRHQKLGYYNLLDSGGHFAAFEQPEIFVGELRKCFRAICE